MVLQGKRNRCKLGSKFTKKIFSRKILVTLQRLYDVREDFS